MEKIMGYGDYHIRNVTILRVYYVEGIGHNLFFIGKFYDSNLEVAFRQHTCFIRNLEGDDLLTGSQGNNLYTLSVGDMMASSPICLLSNASKTKSCLWHRCLSYLNFSTINHLARHGLVRGLPKLKLEKDHLCSACSMGKSKKKPHKPKSEDTNQEKLYLLHMDLCGLIHVTSVNEKKYILFIITANVPEIYMQEFWATVSLHHNSLHFKMNGKTHTLNVENFRDMLQICLRLPGQRFEDPPFEEEILSFIRDLGYTGMINVLIDVNVNYMHQPWRSFAAIINRCLSGKTTSLNSLCLSHSKAYKEYYAVASGAVPPKVKRKYKKKTDEPVTSPKSKTASASKGTRLKSKAKVTQPDIKKQPAKKIVVLSEVALSEAEQIKLATKRSKKYFHISHASGLDKGTSTISGVLDVPPYESKSDKESWGDSKDENDNDDNDDGDKEDEGDNDDDGESDDHDDDSDDERTESNNDEIPDLNLTNVDQTKYEEEDVEEKAHTPSDYELTNEEKLDDEESMDDEQDDEVIKDLYDDVNVNLGNDDAEMTDANQGGSKQQNVSTESGFEQEEDAHVTLTPVHDA
nr:integrase, catalytic region, zinc finger, CCHC-type, peptidase aspartic, catalytic [Tanacetum cinerariifolium]